MKCDSCGHEFPPDEAVVETRNEPTGPVGPLGQGTKMVRVTLCSQCAAYREETKAFIFWPVVIFGIFVVMVVLGSIIKLLMF